MLLPRLPADCKPTMQDSRSCGSLGCNLIRLDNPAKFEFTSMEMEPATIDAGVSAAVEGSVVHNARVILSYIVH